MVVNDWCIEKGLLEVNWKLTTKKSSNLLACYFFYTVLYYSFFRGSTQRFPVWSIKFNYNFLLNKIFNYILLLRTEDINSFISGLFIVSKWGPGGSPLPLPTTQERHWAENLRKLSLNVWSRGSELYVICYFMTWFMWLEMVGDEDGNRKRQREKPDTSN